MNQKLIDSLTHHVLYEGHLLHPPRRDVRSAPRPNSLGRVQPQAALTGSDDPLPGAVQTECLVEGFPSARVSVTARFLHAQERDIGELSVPMAMLPAPNYPDFFHVVPEIVVDNTTFAGRTEAVERIVSLPPFSLEDLLEPRQILFQFPAARTMESIRGPDGMIVGVIVRRQEAVCGTLEVNAEPVDLALTKICLRLTNTTPEPRNGFGDDEDVVLRTFACTHHLLRVEDGVFHSMVEPPEAQVAIAATCRNIGTYPVLIGDPALPERHTLLSSAVFVEDFPTLTTFSAGEAPAELEEALT